MHVEGEAVRKQRSSMWENLERNIAKEKGSVGEYYEREDLKSRLEDPKC